MARLHMTGFEWKDTTADLGPGATGVSGTYKTSPVRTGTYSFAPSSGFAGWSDLGFVTGRTYYFRYYFYSDGTSPGGGGRSLALWFQNDLSTVIGSVYQDSDLSLSLWQGNGVTQVGSSSAVLNANQWYRLEFATQYNGGTGTDYLEALIDGASFASSSSLSLVGAPAEGSCLGPSGAGSAIDDLAINDSTGAAQNSWVGDSKIVLLVPASDNAKGTGWTNDAASSTSLFPSVDNEPPVGIADTTGGSGLHQIRNATSNANVNYDANLTTYTAAGIGSSDTVNVLVPLIATAAPVTTSSKQGTVGVSANPVIANIALGAGGTSGAFWSGVAAGTYPTGWKWSKGTTTYAPTVTLGSAPVMRITQVTSSTRIAMVCAMGMYVDYTPAVTTLPPLPVYVDSAVARSTSY